MAMPTKTRGRCLKCKFHPSLHEWVELLMDERTDDFLRPKFLGCIDNQIFLPMELRFAHARTLL